MSRIVTFISLFALAFTLVACGGSESSNGDSGGESADGTVSLEAGDFFFDPDSATAAAGSIEFELDNVGAAEHNLVIEEEGDAEVVKAAAGESATGTIELDAGTYTYYCSIPGHRASGMEGTLEVS